MGNYFKPYFFQMKAEILRWIAASLILLFEFIVLLILIARKNSQLQPLLKDISRISTPRGKPYSFARTQLYWWTTIIFTRACVDVTTHCPVKRPKDSK